MLLDLAEGSETPIPDHCPNLLGSLCPGVRGEGVDGSTTLGTRVGRKGEMDGATQGRGAGRTAQPPIYLLPAAHCRVRRGPGDSARGLVPTGRGSLDLPPRQPKPSAPALSSALKTKPELPEAVLGPGTVLPCDAVA